MKICTKCGHSKDVDQFHRHPQTKDGRHPTCKVCICRAKAEHYAANRAKKSAKARASYRRNRSKRLETKRRYRTKNRQMLIMKDSLRHAAHPEKRRASAAARYAIKQGVLVKGTCESCGTGECVEGHHEDYANPLDVNWLCRSCHLLLHGERKRATAPDIEEKQG